MKIDLNKLKREIINDLLNDTIQEAGGRIEERQDCVFIYGIDPDQELEEFIKGFTGKEVVFIQ